MRHAATGFRPVGQGASDDRGKRVVEGSSRKQLEAELTTQAEDESCWTVSRCFLVLHVLEVPGKGDLYMLSILCG